MRARRPSSAPSGSPRPAALSRTELRQPEGGPACRKPVLRRSRRSASRLAGEIEKGLVPSGSGDQREAERAAVEAREGKRDLRQAGMTGRAEKFQRLRPEELEVRLRRGEARGDAGRARQGQDRVCA